MADQPQGINFTLEMIQQLVATAVATAIQETKKLPPEEQEVLDLKKKREREAKVSRVKEALQDERLKRAVQFNCELGGHIKHAEGVFKKEHGFRGQVNNDNCCRAQCIRCNQLYPPFRVSEEQMKSGMSLQNAKGLTPEILYQMHVKSFPKCAECEKGICAVRGLRQLKNRALDPEPTILPDGKVRIEQLTA